MGRREDLYGSAEGKKKHSSLNILVLKEEAIWVAGGTGWKFSFFVLFLKIVLTRGQGLL